MALRAAGTYLQFRTGLKVADYLELLAAERTRLDHLKVPQATRDVRATLNLSATLLDTDDPELAARWRQLAVFPSAFRPDAAAAVWGAPDLDAADTTGQAGVALAARLRAGNRAGIGCTIWCGRSPAKGWTPSRDWKPKRGMRSIIVRF